LDATSTGLVTAALAIAVVVLIVIAALLWRRVAALDRRIASLTSAGDGHSLESTLHATLDKVAALSTDVERLRGRATVMEAVQKKAVQRTGLQSFAVALLDDQGDGVVISSLHARQNTRVYAKAIAGGRSEAALSDEESEALRKAMAQGTPGAKSS
jgi:hypothetical protein